MLKGVQLRTEFTFVPRRSRKITYELSIGYHVFNQETGARVFCSFLRLLGAILAAFYAHGWRPLAR